MKIAIIDTMGITYDGDTLSKRGLGGSESAVILMSRELVKLEFEVTVLNKCENEGQYDGVNYIDLDSNLFNQLEQFDIVISSRSVYPFIDNKFEHLLKDNTYKVLWMHDTFCRGDEYIEQLITSGTINTIFTLSDFHTSYITNCDHNHKRMFEVLKKNIFITRNGIVKYDTNETKDPNLFVYNASVTKGMLPLVLKIWPDIKRLIPEARLKVIGGYYRISNEPDEQEKIWHELVADPKFSRMDIDFVGIIKQSAVANILAKASYMLYPSAFPETFGISSLESLYYNTPIITCRFGALEETAIESACYLMNYPIEPNGLFPSINSDHQIDQFIKMAYNAYTDQYLYNQKMNACNIINDICGWDTVALQWKQHFYKKLGLYLNRDEYQKVTYINSRVHEVFNRRFMNPEEYMIPRNNQRRMLIITPMYNAENYIKKCIQSVVTQDYDNYIMVIIDDNSTDNSVDIVSKYDHPNVFLVTNEENRGALANQIQNILSFYDDFGDIVVLLDGDDSLVNDNQIFHKINNIYKDHQIAMTYGSCWSMVDNIPLVAQPYPKEVWDNKSFREYIFALNVPYTHLRTFEMRYLTDQVIEKCKNDDGEYYKAGGDIALFYALLEELNHDQVKVVQDILVNYNDMNPINDYKVNGEEQTKNANKIVKEKSMNKTKSILIAVPTNKYVETATMKSIYDLEIPNGCRTELQFFYGYRVDQIRNLIAEWGKNYDYLFCVDSDIVLPRDALCKMVFEQVDIVSGIYVQRLPGFIPEVYKTDYTRYDISDLLQSDRLIEIGASGFGCILINSDVLNKMEYPHFVYKPALDHNNTFSEDLYFCKKARELGYKIWCNTTIQCDHIGQTVYGMPETINGTKKKDLPPLEDYIAEVAKQDLLPKCHVEYLHHMKAHNVDPKVIFDVGACVGHWGRHAKDVWKDATIIGFEANKDVIKTLENSGLYDGVICSVVSHSFTEVDFYHNPYNLGGNSYYKENSAEFNESHIEKRSTSTLDDIYYSSGILPDLIKIDVQGAELDVLEGSSVCLNHCKDVIIECQHTDYNENAPKFDAIKSFLERRGFKLVGNFCMTEVDGDYHYTKRD